MKATVKVDMYDESSIQLGDFCILEHHTCQKQIQSPQCPSPTSSILPSELEVLEQKIDEANKLLLKLALADKSSRNETFQHVFDGVTGLHVRITLHVAKDKLIRGRVHFVGCDFVVLHNEKQEIILPFNGIEKVEVTGRFAQQTDQSHLNLIDPCFLRDITNHFGDVVSSSPELLQLFFRIRLEIYLLLLEAKRIYVRLDDSFFEGLLTDVDKESIVIKVKDQLKIIPLNRIGMVTV